MFIKLVMSCDLWITGEKLVKFILVPSIHRNNVIAFSFIRVFYVYECMTIYISNIF